jgi:hypothetical protein
MSNPTIGNESQFNSSFSTIVTKPGANPTLAQSQFRSPFNILPDVDLTEFNTTIAASAQFDRILQLGNYQTYDILPNIALGRKNPTTQQQQQFTTPLTLGNDQTFDILPNVISRKNPTIGRLTASPGKPGPLQMGSFTTYDIPDYPALEDLPFSTPYTKPAPVYIPGDALPVQYLTSWYYGPLENARYRFNASPSALNNIISLIKGEPTTGVPLYQSTNILNLGSAITQQTGLSQGLSFSPNFAATFGGNQFNTPYNSLLLSQLTDNLLQNTFERFRTGFVKLLDFRARVNLLRPSRNDGKSMTNSFIRFSGKGEQYFEAAKSREGAYSQFNLSAPGKNGYGWGEHDAPGADRSDFTQTTQAATRWNENKQEWEAYLDPKVANTPFRGDKVNVIDLKRAVKLDQAYIWKPTAIGAKADETNSTQDFIKFYFTGPNLQNGLPKDSEVKDDIMVFRTIITQLNDSFNANWTPVNLIGRADPNYHYTGYSRDLSLSFDVYATSRDELKFIWRKLNALAGYTAPEYNSKEIAMRAPWMRITIGDLFIQQPVVLNSLSYDYATDASWEINIEDDPTNMQVPFKIGVSCQFNLISDYLPQKNGRFFSLAKQYESNAKPITGDDNWLSDFLGNTAPRPEEIPVPPQVGSGPTRENRRLGSAESNDPVSQ